MRRPAVALLASGAVMITSVGLAPAGESAPKLPVVGAPCGLEDMWRGIPVRKVQSKKTKEVALVAAKGKSRDNIVCVPAHLHELSVGGAELGTWEYLSDWHLRSPMPDWSKVDLTMDPANDPCRLQSKMSPSDGIYVGLRWDPASSATVKLLPSDRRVRGLVLHSWNPNTHPRETPPDIALVNETMRQAVQLADEYWGQQSLGKFGLDLDYTTKLQTQSRSYHEVLDSVDGEIDFSRYDFVIKTGPFSTGGMVDFTRSFSRDGKDFDFLIHMGNLAPVLNQYQYMLMHEIGHALGLPDLYGLNPENSDGTRFVGSHTMMGRGSYYLTGYERWILGWMPDSRVRCVSKRGVGEVTLASVEPTGTGPGMIIFPVSSDQAVVVENSSHLPVELLAKEQLLFTYWVNASSQTSLDAGWGEPDICVELGSDPNVCTRDNQPAMVTYRAYPETLYRATSGRPLGIPDEPVESEFDDDAEFERAYHAWQVEVYRRRNAVNLGPYTGTGRFFEMQPAWLGFQITESPQRRGEETSNPRWFFRYKFSP